MKKSLVLTSVLALAACAGSGTGTGIETPGAVTNPEYYPSGSTSDNMFSQNGAGISTQIVSNKEEVIAYVESRIGAPAAKSNAARSAVKLGDVEGWSIDERYERAVAALTQMEKVMNDMIAMAGDESKLNDYIAKNSDQVKDALKLLMDDANIASAGKDIDDASSDKLAEIFRDQDIKSAEDLQRAKEQHVPQAKIQKIDDIDFRIADIEKSTRTMKVKTENGKVVGISDTGWEKPGQDEMFVTGRIGNNTSFNKVSYEYNLDFGENDETVLYGLDVYSVDGNLTDAQIKEQAIARLDQMMESKKADCEKMGGAYCDEIPYNEYEATRKRIEEGKYTVNKYEYNTVQSVESLGHLAGLSYSDFGILKKTIGVTNPEGKYEGEMILNSPYAGGYDSKAIDKSAMSGEMVFNGTAAIAVDYTERVWVNDNGDWEEGDSKTMTSISNSAKLVFKDGKETLTMTFPDYYTIVMTNNDITLSDADKVKDKDFVFKSIENGKTGSLTYTGQTSGSFETGYYGDNGRASEATAIFGYGEEAGGERYTDRTSDAGYELEMTGAFGGKR